MQIKNREELFAAIQTSPILFNADLHEIDLSRWNCSRNSLLTRSHIKNSIEVIGLIEANFTKANLANTDLSELNLSYSIFEDADMTRTVLTGANLSRSTITKDQLLSANLYHIRENFFTYCRHFSPRHIQELLYAIEAGKMDGRYYATCLSGTLENILGKSLVCDDWSPKERFCTAIWYQDTPQNNPIAFIVTSWLEELLQIGWDYPAMKETKNLWKKAEEKIQEEEKQQS